MSAALSLVTDDRLERDCRYPNVAMALDLMRELDTAFGYLAEHHAFELAQFNRRYPECFFGDVPF
jgi:hypothetical protein